MGNRIVLVMTLWSCDAHLKEWFKLRKEQLAGKRKRGDDGKDDKVKQLTCQCNKTASRTRYVQFFEATHDLWPVLWKDDSLRRTVAVCQQRHDLQPLELDVMDPQVAYHLFFNLVFGSRWSKIPADVDEYWRYQRIRSLHVDPTRRPEPTAMASWHTLACIPAGTLAVSLMEEAHRQGDAGT